MANEIKVTIQIPLDCKVDYKTKEQGTASVLTTPKENIYEGKRHVMTIILKRCQVIETFTMMTK